MKLEVLFDEEFQWPRSIFSVGVSVSMGVPRHFKAL